MDSKNLPTVSIIMPTYNRAAIIERSINSVLQQTFSDWELIIVDDFSNDNTPSVVNKYVGDRIRYIRHPQNRMVSAARNTGIFNSRNTKYLAFIDDDDEWLPEKLSKQVQLIENNFLRLGAVGCGRVDISKEEAEVHIPQHRGYLYEKLLSRSVRGYGAPLMLVNRELNKDIFFDESLPCLEDNDFVMRIAKKHPLDYVPEVLVKVFLDKQIPHVWNHTNALDGYKKIYKKYRDDIIKMPDTNGYYCFCIARELANLYQMKESRKWLRNMIKSNRMMMAGTGWIIGTFWGHFGIKICNKFIKVSPPQL